MQYADRKDRHFFQIRGVPGAGKTTVASVINSLSPDEISIIATDDFWGEHEEFDPDRVEEAHEWCRKRVEEITRRGTPIVIIHNTAAEYWEMESYEQIAKESDYVYHRLIVEDHHGSGSTKENVDERLRDYMERKFQVRLKTP